jgi:hypothetical protein
MERPRSIEDHTTVRNPRRRSFLLFGATGLGAFVLGRLIGDDLARLFSFDGAEHHKKIGGFSVIEKRSEMIIKDQSGEEVFVIDTESFRRDGNR